jgi:hypothetical protein
MPQVRENIGWLRKVCWTVGGAAALLLVMLSAMLLVMPGSQAVAPAAQGAALAPVAAEVTVGTGAPGVNLYEFVGRIDQNGFAFTGYGYVSYLRGLSYSQIFTNPIDASERSAHFTYYATATLTSRSIISNVFVINSEGPITFYYQPTPTGTFSNPQSFAGGTPIATGTIRYQSILNVQAPNQGIANGIGEFTQLTAPTFTIGSETYQFGQAGTIQRMTTFGQGTRLDAVLPRSFVLLAGNAVDTGQRQLNLPYVSNDGGY